MEKKHCQVTCESVSREFPYHITLACLCLCASGTMEEIGSLENCLRAASCLNTKCIINISHITYINILHLVCLNAMYIINLLHITYIRYITSSLFLACLCLCASGTMEESWLAGKLFESCQDGDTGDRWNSRTDIHYLFVQFLRVFVQCARNYLHIKILGIV